MVYTAGFDERLDFGVFSQSSFFSPSFHINTVSFVHTVVKWEWKFFGWGQCAFLYSFIALSQYRIQLSTRCWDSASTAFLYCCYYNTAL